MKNALFTIIVVLSPMVFLNHMQANSLDNHTTNNVDIIMNDDVRTVCRVIKKTWEKCNHTPAENTFINLITSNDDTIPSDVLLNALSQTSSLLQ